MTEPNNNFSLQAKKNANESPTGHRNKVAPLVYFSKGLLVTAGWMGVKYCFSLQAKKNANESPTGHRNRTQSRSDFGALRVRQLNHCLLVDDQLELHSKLFGCFSTQKHTLHKNFKVIHYRAILCINAKLQFNNCPVRVDF